MHVQKTFHIIVASGIVIGSSCMPLLLTYAADGQAVASQPDDPRAVAAPPDLDPVAFEKWVIKTRHEIDAARQEPSAITDAILKRLKDGPYVTDKAVMCGIGGWTAYEGWLAQRASGKKNNNYDRTIAMIDKVSALLYGRPWLMAQLQIKKAKLYNVEGDCSEAIAVRQTANTELESLYEKVSTHYIDNMTILGQLLYSQGKKKEAENVFLDVLSYPWYLTKSPTMQVLRDRYVQAGRGLIDCRRGNLHALQGTFFVPASLDKLGPYLNEALVEAGGKPREGLLPAVDEEVLKSSGKPKP